MSSEASPTRRYGGRSGAERMTRRRERLVAAAVEVLGERGEAGATVTAICGRAGLTERYFYESFGGRDDAFVAALDAVTTTIGEVALGAVAAASGPAVARVAAGLRGVVDLLADEPPVGRVALVESAAVPALRERRHALVGRLADLVTDQARELYDDAPAPAVARLRGVVYVAGFSELVATWLAGDVDLDREGLVGVGADLFAAVMRPGPPA